MAINLIMIHIMMTDYQGIGRRTVGRAETAGTSNGGWSPRYVKGALLGGQVSTLHSGALHLHRSVATGGSHWTDS